MALGRYSVESVCSGRECSLWMEFPGSPGSTGSTSEMRIILWFMVLAGSPPAWRFILTGCEIQREGAPCRTPYSDLERQVCSPVRTQTPEKCRCNYSCIWHLKLLASPLPGVEWVGWGLSQKQAAASSRFHEGRYPSEVWQAEGGGRGSSQQLDNPKRNFIPSCLSLC